MTGFICIFIGVIVWRGVLVLSERQQKRLQAVEIEFLRKVMGARSIGKERNVEIRKLSQLYSEGYEIDVWAFDSNGDDRQMNNIWEAKPVEEMELEK